MNQNLSIIKRIVAFITSKISPEKIILFVSALINPKGVPAVIIPLTNKNKKSCVSI
jgi:ribosomal protein L7Ae-like RNA K-turn-binding protein